MTNKLSQRVAGSVFALALALGALAGAAPASAMGFGYGFDCVNPCHGFGGFVRPSVTTIVDKDLALDLSETNLTTVSVDGSLVEGNNTIAVINGDGNHQAISSWSDEQTIVDSFNTLKWTSITDLTEITKVGTDSFCKYPSSCLW